MNSFNSLNNSPADGEFSKIDEFHCSLKNSIISEEEYASVKELYTLMRRNLGDLNTHYNFKDTIIICEIFGSRSTFSNNKFKFNPRKYDSASSFSGCVQREKCKCIIALPTNSDHVMLFEKNFDWWF